MHHGLRTGYAAVDGELARLRAGVTGMVLRHELEVRRNFHGGPAQIERTNTIITKLERVDVDPALFECRHRSSTRDP